MFCHLQRNIIQRGFISILRTARPIELGASAKNARINVIHKKGFKDFAHEDEKLNPWEYGYPLMLFILALPLFNFKRFNETFNGNPRMEYEDAYNENIAHVYLDEKEEPPETKILDALALSVLDILGGNVERKYKDEAMDK